MHVKKHAPNASCTSRLASAYQINDGKAMKQTFKCLTLLARVSCARVSSQPATPNKMFTWHYQYQWKFEIASSIINQYHNINININIMSMSIFFALQWKMKIHFCCFGNGSLYSTALCGNRNKDNGGLGHISSDGKQDREKLVLIARFMLWWFLQVLGISIRYQRSDIRGKIQLVRKESCGVIRVWMIEG